MKRMFLFSLMIFGNIFINAQTEVLIKNNNEAYIGTIDSKAKIKVVFNSVSLEKKSLETYTVSGFSDVEGSKANFEGTIRIDEKNTKNIQDSVFRIYQFQFFENGQGKHNGIFSGDIIMKTFSKDFIIIDFEGHWENYTKSLKFPVHFDNRNTITTQ